MPGYRPSLHPHSAGQHLKQLIRPDIDASLFAGAIRLLNRMSDTWVAACPPPWPAPGLIVTPEIRYQSELYLPIAEIAPAFNRLYRSALTFPPVLGSAPFNSALSWADAFNALPPRFRFSANPARLLEALLGNRALLEAFLFASFLPRRFYGGPVRYPEQEKFVRGWLAKRRYEPLRCLDAACGEGAGSYDLARLLLDEGWKPGRFVIEGWTLDPLEVWAAAHAAFPHDPQRQELFRSWAAPVFERRAEVAMLFKQADLLERTEAAGPFDLILCNGLLGGPIINKKGEMGLVAANLAALLRPGGLLLAANRFHGGWKKQIPEEALGDLFKQCGLVVLAAGEGVCGLIRKNRIVR